LGYGDIVDAPGGVPAFDFWYNKNVTKYPYNPNKTKEILDNLGFVDVDGDGWREAPNGTKIEIELCNLAGYPPYIRMGDIIVEQLAAVGIKAKNAPVEWEAQSKKAHERDFDILVWGWTISPEPSQYLGQFRDENPYWSCGEMRNETFNEIFDAQKTELDINKRREMIFKLQEILAQELPVIPIWAMNVIEAYRLDTFTGYIPAPMGIGGIYNKLTWLSIRPVTITQKPIEVIPTWVYASFVVLIIIIIALVALLLRKRRTKFERQNL
jgi:peptide/nickel transport system substrate-binding protein